MDNLDILKSHIKKCWKPGVLVETDGGGVRKQVFIDPHSNEQGYVLYQLASSDPKRQSERPIPRALRHVLMEIENVPEEQIEIIGLFLQPQLLESFCQLEADDMCSTCTVRNYGSEPAS